MDSKKKARKVANILVKAIVKKGVKDIVSYALLPVIGAAMMTEGADLLDGVKEIMGVFSDSDKIA
ncbi:MAG: hypothetical protein ACR2LR_25835 [Hassallia sp.]